MLSREQEPIRPLQPLRQAGLLGWVSRLLWLGVVLPWWVQWSMTTDGLVYSTIGRNLAQTPVHQWWQLHFTERMHPHFFEHPPLSFWLFGAWLRLVDDSHRAEATFAAALALGLYASLSALAKAQWPTSGATASLAPLLLMTSPMVSWLLGNHMLEGPFLLLVVLQGGNELRSSPKSHPKWLWGG